MERGKGKYGYWGQMFMALGEFMYELGAYLEGSAL